MWCSLPIIMKEVEAMFFSSKNPVMPIILVVLAVFLVFLFISLLPYLIVIGILIWVAINIKKAIVPKNNNADYKEETYVSSSESFDSSADIDLGDKTVIDVDYEKVD